MKRINSNQVGEVWIFQRKEKGNWYYSYTKEKEQVTNSLGTSNLGKATELAKELCPFVDKKIEENALQRLDLPETIEDGFIEYLAYLVSEGCSPKTITRYTSIYNMFNSFCDKVKIYKCEDISQRLLNRYRQSRQKEVSDSTRYFESERILEFCSYLVTEGVIKNNPLSLAKIKKPPKIPLPWFILEQVENILRLASSRDKPVFEVLAFTGLRISELQRLKWSHVNFETKEITVLSTIENPTKSKKTRIVPMHSRVEAVLSKILKRKGLVFNACKSRKFPDGSGPINASSLYDRLTDICKELEIDGCLHSFRKFFSSYMANKGVPVLVLKDWLGHGDVKILIEHYYKLNQNESVEFMQKVSDSEGSSEDSGTLEGHSQGHFKIPS